MTFITPALLAGIGLIAVPIALHLVMRRQPQLLDFPAMRFLQARAETNRRQLRLRQLLLLLLRCAVIGLLAFALARPSLQGSGVLGSQEAPVAAVLVFDTSPSMDYLQKNDTRIDQARELASWLITQLPADSEVAVLTSRSTSETFSVSRSAAQQRIDRLRTSPIARPLNRLLELAMQMAADSPLERKEVYLLTDMSASAWDERPSGALAQQLAEQPDVAIYLVDVGVDSPRNVGLADLRLSSETIPAGRPLRIETDLIATTDAGSREVDLWLDDGGDAPEKRRQQTVAWQDGQQQQMTFELGGLAPGTHQGYLQIVGEDGLAFDDRRNFTVDVTTSLPVLIATGPGAEPLFWREAITVAGFESEVVSLDQLGGQTLSSYAAICLLDPGALSAATWRSLSEYAEQGGGVAIFLGRNARRDEFNSEAAQRLLPGRLKRIARDAQQFSPTTLQHPLLASFRRFAGAIPWSAFPVFAAWQLEGLADDAQVVLPFASGAPALIEQSLGEGRVLTMTTPVSDPPNVRGRDPWNLLPAGEAPWPFVLLAGEMASRLAGGDADRLNYRPGETAVLHVPQTEPTALFLLTTPRGDSLRQSIDPSRPSIVIAATEQPGNYRVRAGGVESGLQRGFSVNVPQSMSRLARIEHSQLDQLFGADRYRVAHSRRQLEDRVSTGRVGLKLFPLVMILMAAALGCEHWLSNRFYRENNNE